MGGRMGCAWAAHGARMGSHGGPHGGRRPHAARARPSCRCERPGRTLSRSTTILGVSRTSGDAAPSPDCCGAPRAPLPAAGLPGCCGCGGAPGGGVPPRLAACCAACSSRRLTLRGVPGADAGRLPVGLCPGPGDG
jgi:hypothetical protein